MTKATTPFAVGQTVYHVYDFGRQCPLTVSDIVCDVDTWWVMFLGREGEGWFPVVNYRT